MAFKSHKHAAYKTAANGRFVIYKNLHLGTHGHAGSKLVLEDTTTGQIRNFNSMAYIKCSIVHDLHGLELAPYFGSTAKDGEYKDCKVKIKLENHGEYQEIKA